MRALATRASIVTFMRQLGSAATGETRIYLTGGATAVLLGWRETTIDLDIKIVPERDEIFKAIPVPKESLHVNVELASPDLFIPALPGWDSRSLFISREGRIDWFHYDPYAQTLAKIERGHDRDRGDVHEFLTRGLVKSARLRELYQEIAPSLIRYPSIDPKSFGRKLDEALSG